MNLSIMNNVASLTAYTALSASNANLAKSIGRLSTGLRINSAADDPSGLAISERFQTQINGLNRASMNAQDGISMMQLAEGAMNETQSMLQRMRELALQAANGTLTASDRVQIQTEVDQLKQEIDRIAQSTEFNTRQLLNGDGSGIWSTDSPNILTASLTGQVQEGNYRIIVQASATGTNDVWKSEVMQLNKPVAADQNSMRVGLSNLNGSMLSTAGLTIDNSLLNKSMSFSYKYLQGQAAEIIGQTAIMTNLAGNDLAICAVGTSMIGAKSVSTVSSPATLDLTGNDANACSTATLNFATSGDITIEGYTVQFAKGTYTIAQVECAIQTYTAAGSINVTWAANAGPAGGYFMHISATASAQITTDVGFAAATGISLNGAILSTAATFIQKGATNTENANLFFMKTNGILTAQTSTSFDICANGTSRTITFTFNNPTTSMGTLATYSSLASLTENDVLDTINNRLISGSLGVRAQIDVNHSLSFVVTTADGTLAPSKFTISNIVRGLGPAGVAATSAITVTSLGIAAGTFTGLGNGKVVFSVNQSTVYTATLASTTYSGSTTGMNQLASDLETAMNNAIMVGSGTQDNLVDVVYDPTAESFHMISRRVGLKASAVSEVQLFDGAGQASILSSIGWNLNTHALGNNDGISLAIYRGVGSDRLATNIYNRRGINSSATTWNVADALNTNAVSANATLAALGLNLSFSTAAANVGNEGNFNIDVTKIGDLSYLAKGSNSLGELAQFNGILDKARNITLYANGHNATIHFDKATTLNDLQNMIVSAVTSSADNRGLGLQIDGSPAAQNTVYQHVADYITNTSEGTY
ncbi:MAG: hypothetical protein HQK58_11905, partial [Deltaproteobacteria bacterium]|nr:hypothetical protein [Deltaproteobacteria bacterium]